MSVGSSDQPFTAADVQPYVDFFDSHGTSNDQLLAYYLLGRSYHEQGEAPMAALLGVSRQRITNLRSSINQKLFNKKSARNLDVHLIALGANL